MNNSNYVLVLYTETGKGGFSRKNWKNMHTKLQQHRDFESFDLQKDSK